MSKRDIEALRAYDLRSGVTVAHQDQGQHLRDTLTDIERRLAIHVATRASCLSRIVDGRYEARQGLDLVTAEILELSKRQDYLRRTIHRQSALSADGLSA